ncbi:MAG: hypothetical protein J6P31_00080 [Oscillospiraceae bacterium]|nr:hypothetical protein [Oscillospiraceae bacterium]
MTLQLTDEDHLTLSASGGTRYYVRENREARALEPFLGAWQTTNEGGVWVDWIAYKDGHILHRENSQSTQRPGFTVDSYSLSKDGKTLTLYDDGFKGGSTTCVLLSDGKMRTTNGEGNTSVFVPVMKGNWPQMPIDDSEKTPNGMPVGTSTMPSIISPK